MIGLASTKLPDVAKALRDKIYAVVTPLIDLSVQRICLLDPPGHSNVGDSAILLGELEYLRCAFPNAQVIFFDIDSYSAPADAQIDAADVLLLHGGGNFGDTWPHHHQFRSNILERFPGKRIVQFPQSIYFSSESALDETARMIERHGNFELLVRDRKSFSVAQKMFACTVQLCPDMAFAMTPLRRLEPSVECFCLLRSDKEAIAKHDEIITYLRSRCESLEVDDWLGDKRLSYASIDRRLSRAIRRAPVQLAFLAPGAMRVRELYAQERLSVGVEMLSRGRIVVTDRLHAHILSCLLGIPNAVFDSMDGKISAFHDTWLEGTAHSRICTSTDELHAFLEQNRRSGER